LFCSKTRREGVLGFAFFFLNLAKNRVLGIFCFFEIVCLGEGMSNSEIQKYFEINFNSHIIKKTFGLIYSFLKEE